LEALEEKDAEFSRMRERIFSLGDLSYAMTLSSVPSCIDRGKELVIQGSVTNKSGSDWPVCVRSEKILRVGAELYSGAEKTRCAAARYCIESQELRHDECVHFELRLPTEKAATGRCEFVVDLVYEGVVWFRDRGGEPVRGSLDIVPTA
jgi:hypothetical protein